MGRGGGGRRNSRGGFEIFGGGRGGGFVGIALGMGVGFENILGRCFFSFSDSILWKAIPLKHE